MNISGSSIQSSPRVEHVEFSDNVDALIGLCEDNLSFFSKEGSDYDRKMSDCFKSIRENLPSVRKSAFELQNIVSDYDFENVHGNGLRSLVRVAEVVVARTKSVATEITEARNSFFFRKETAYKRLLAHEKAIDSSLRLFDYAEILVNWSEPGKLVPPPTDDHLVGALVRLVDKPFNQYCFYGRCLGIQFCDSIAMIFKTLMILMASFSEMYYSNGKLLDPVLKSGKYLYNPELRAKRVVNISQYGSVNFCKSFWLLGEIEIMARVQSILNALPVCKVITIEPQDITLPKVGSESETVIISPPTSLKGLAPLEVRLLSCSKRYGMNGDENEDGVKLPSDELVVHCHGGGFIAQSSRSHETYLRQWAVDIDAPIVSIDYSLAPECPYPRPLEDAFYGYCWALLNLRKLGSSGKRVVLAGDSAGGNLVLGVALKCIEHQIRLPDGIFVAYVPMLLRLIAAPSRLLCLIDPLLPFGFLLGCIKAYCCTKEEFEKSLAPEEKLKIGFHVAEESPSISKPSSPCAPDGKRPIEDPVIMTMKQQDPGFFQRFLSSVTNVLAADKTSPTDSERLSAEMTAETYKLCPDDMLDFTVSTDNFLSPLLASNDTLEKLPPVSILTTEFDPFLDDCVDFAKKLKSLGHSPTLDVLLGLSHGFLNFSQVSKEATEGSLLCSARIKQLLRPDVHDAEEP